MAHIGFSKLKAMIAKSGANNPGAVAASIGRKKYGDKAMEKAASSHTALKESQTKKK